MDNADADENTKILNKINRPIFILSQRTVYKNCSFFSWTVYDPDFEDDFNAFFGKTHISKKKSDLTNEEGWAFVVPETSEQDNLNQTNSKQDNANTKTVWQQLLEKFSK